MPRIDREGRSGEVINTRVMVIGDHPIVRDGIAAVLREAGCEVVVGNGQGPAAVTSVQGAEADVVIVDMNVHPMEGIDLVKQIREHAQGVPVLVLSLHNEIPYAVRAMRAGAQGFLSKRSRSEEMVEAVRRLGQGGTWFSDRAARAAVQGPTADRGATVASLTDRELSVYEHIGHGRTSQEIAKLLGISQKTVETYRERIKAKLGIANATQLIRASVEWLHQGRFQ